MWIARFAVPAALVLAMLFACLAPSEPAPRATVTAREVLTQAQRAGGRNYTFTLATGAELGRLELPRPPAEAPREALEGLLEAAGFVLTPAGAGALDLFRVERAGS
jgi:hypothetical protein